jgi:hypothetical protein
MRLSERLRQDSIGRRLSLTNHQPGLDAATAELER